MNSLDESLDVVLRFGTMMLRAGDTASAWRGEELVTVTRETGPPGIDAERISALERLASSSKPGLSPHQLAAQLDAIEAAPPLRSIATVAIAIGLASGAFSYLNGGDLLGTGVAVVAGGCGQALRALL